MKKLAALSLAAAVVSLAGCAIERQADFRYPRPDELRPGDIPPDVDAPVSRTRIPDELSNRPRPLPYYAPPPPISAYQIPIPPRQQPRAPINCTTRWVGQTAYTDCH